MTDDTRLARSQNSTPGGKCVRRIDVPLTEDLDDAITAVATVMGIPRAEFVRNVLHRFMFGELSMVRMMARMGLSNPSDEYPGSNHQG